MAIFSECICSDLGHHWDVRLEGLQDSIVKSAPSVSTAPKSFLHSPRTNRFLSCSLQTCCMCQGPGGLAPPASPLSQQRLFSQRKLKMKAHRPYPSAVNKTKGSSPLHPLACEELWYIRGELWNGEVQTLKRRTGFSMTKALSAKTFSV